jgi:hypothetical protein
MQVQIVENWADLEGDVRSVTRGSDVNGFDVVELDVRATRDVGVFPNFFAQSVGEVVRVYVPHDIVVGLPLNPGARVNCRVRKAGPTRVFIDPRQVSVRAP